MGETASDSDLSFSNLWVRIRSFKNAYDLLKESWSKDQKVGQRVKIWIDVSVSIKIDSKTHGWGSDNRAH